MAERLLPKQKVVGSNPISRSNHNHYKQKQGHNKVYCSTLYPPNLCSRLTYYPIKSSTGITAFD